MQVIMAPVMELVGVAITQLVRFNEFGADRFAAELKRADHLESALAKLFKVSFQKSDLLPFENFEKNFIKIIKKYFRIILHFPYATGSTPGVITLILTSMSASLSCVAKSS